MARAASSVCIVSGSCPSSRALAAFRLIITTITTATAMMNSTAKAKKTSNDFEKMFLENSRDRMTQSEGTDGPLGENGTGGGVYRSMLTKEYANKIVQSGGVGIADSVFPEMMKMQGATNVGA